VNPHLDLLLSVVYDGALAPAHRADLEKSGLTSATIAAQGIRSVPPALFTPLLGFDPSGIQSALLFPYPDPAGGWFDHVRVKVFPPLETRRGTIKYLQPRRSGVRIFFPVGSKAALRAAGTLLIVEGEKKALDYAQRSRNLLQALSFLISWPALERAASLVLQRSEELDGDHYEILARAADALAGKYPLAAVMVLRAMINFSLTNSRSTRYKHAARHLLDCAGLSSVIEDFGGFEPHAAYEARLRREHGRKSSFWILID